MKIEGSKTCEARKDPDSDNWEICREPVTHRIMDFKTRHLHLANSCTPHAQYCIDNKIDCRVESIWNQSGEMI